jgi:rhodanese-related sulfurtransferase
MKNILSTLLASVLLVMTMGTAYANESPVTVEGAKTINASEAKALFDKGVLFVDVRSDKDWAAGRIPDAVHIELKKVFSEEALSKAAKKDDSIVIYCNGVSCMRSSKASTQAVGWGFTNVHYYRLGFPGWKAAGYPTE